MESDKIKRKSETKVNQSKSKKLGKGSRKSNPKKWKANVRKKAIKLGQSYVRSDGTVVPAKTLGEVCQNCRLRCPENVTEEIRQQFFDRYYNILTLSEKRQFLLRYVTTVDVKHRRGSSDSRRKYSRMYFIGTGVWEDGNETMIKVCQVMFLNTLSISNKIVRAAYERLLNTNGTSFEDLRGKFIRKKCEDLSEQQMMLVKDHIKCFPLLDNFMPRIYDLYCDHLRKMSAKPELFVSLETYKSIYEKELEEKFTPKAKYLKKQEIKTENVESNEEISHQIDTHFITLPLENQIWDEKPQTIVITEQINGNPIQNVYYEKNWMESETSETEPKISFINYEMPLMKVEVEEEKIQRTQMTNEKKMTNDKSKSIRKRKSDPSLWLSNIRKNANLHGLSYTKSDGTIKPAKALKEFCRNCRLKCSSRFTDDLRQQFFDRYYRLSSINEKYQFIIRYTKIVKIKQRKSEVSRRKISRLYYLGTGTWENGSESLIQVCQTTFLNTLCISGKTLQTAYQKLWNNNGTSFGDLRGSHNRKKKKVQETNVITDEDVSTANILANM